MAIFKPETGRTYEIALKYKSGKECKSLGKTPELMFTLTTGDILYLPVSVAEEIKALNLAPQETFLLTKLTKGAWTIERKPQPVAPRPQLVQVDKSNVRPKSKAELMNEFGELLVSASDLPPAKVNGNGECALRVAFRTVIDEAAEAERYAAEKGLSIRFDEASIRCIVNTVLIGMQQAAR